MSARVCMLVHHYFPRDVRVRREARALAAAGHEVRVICLRRPGQPARERWQGIEIVRLPVWRHRGSPLAVYLAEYGAMTGLATAALARHGGLGGFDVIHAHAPPDFLLAAAWPARLRGARLVLDVHDLSPELFGQRFGRRGGRLVRWMLAGTEAAACRLADKVITVTEVFGRRLIERGLDPAKLLVLHNCPDEEIFEGAEPVSRPAGDAFSIVHHGTLVQRYGVDVLLEAFTLVAPRLPNARLDVFGEGDARPALQARAARAELAGRVTFHGDVLQDELVSALAQADLCAVPNRSDPFTDLLLPTKLLEALRMGVACVASATPTIAQAFSSQEVRLVPPGDPAALAEAILELASDAEGRLVLARAGRAAAERYRWSVEKDRLLELYRELTGR